jgi:carbon-monoxide dehydrogenase medium subunit
LKPSSFAYHAPKTVEEAVALLARVAPEQGRILAGGQSLVPIMNFRLAAPGHLIDINRIDGLDQLRVENGALVIPACVRHAAFERDVKAGALGWLLGNVVCHIAHHPIRTRGTFCGSLAHADPSSEWCLVAATLDAVLVARSSRGSRAIPAAEFFTGIMSTALEPDELLVEVRLPLLPDDSRFGFDEVNRRAGDFALGMALAVYRMENGKIADARLGVGGAEARPRRIPEAEAALNGKPPTPDTFVAAAKAAAGALADVLEDARSSAQFRRELVLSSVRRALEASLP